ncbi:MAG: nicotinate (nicotinamide) nucleotide adenylyltransferase [Burkholderiaceae bacterium]|nr:nicotinate (nicotinamide) nucleotide adenylyltransferase [Burkholderiaceae bacterium]
MGVTGAAPLGLLGGSFDPIHNGHLQLARDALERLRLSEVHFIPAAQPWQKDPMTAAEHRAQMVRLGIAGEARFVLDMREIARGGITYTIDTLRDLRLAFPERPLVLILGSDQFARLDTWRSWKEIIEMAHIAVAQRAGTAQRPGPEWQAVIAARRGDVAAISKCARGSVVEFVMTPIDVSATEVRRLLHMPPSTERAQRLSAMVPAAVLDYIDSHHLYRD